MCSAESGIARAEATLRVRGIPTDPQLSTETTAHCCMQEIEAQLDRHLATFDEIVESLRENYRNQLLSAKSEARVGVPVVIGCACWWIHT
jgi:hypothetical protein